MIRRTAKASSFTKRSVTLLCVAVLRSPRIYHFLAEPKTIHRTAKVKLPISEVCYQRSRYDRIKLNNHDMRYHDNYWLTLHFIILYSEILKLNKAEHKLSCTEFSEQYHLRTPNAFFDCSTFISNKNNDNIEQHR